MRDRNKSRLNTRIDEGQVRVLFDLEETTRQSIASVMNGSLELYARFQNNGGAAFDESLPAPAAAERSPDRDGNS